MNLRARLAECLPRDSVSLRALLQISRIEEDKSIPTALVTFGVEPCLRINPEFVNRHATTPEKLQALIGHELLHVTLGHTRRYAQCTDLDNLVLDAIVNAIWCKAYPTLEDTALYRDFYSEKLFPQCFLRPPDDWHPRDHVRLPAGLLHKRYAGVEFVKDVYRRLWGKPGASASELREALRLGADGLGLPLSTVLRNLPLLGGHDDSQVQGKSQTVTSNAFVRGFVKELSEQLEGLTIEPHLSVGDLLKHGQIRPYQISVRAHFRSLFAYLAGGVGTAQLGAVSFKTIESLSPMPSKDRRAIVQRSLGQVPLLYRTESIECSSKFSERVHVYMDVSESMYGVIAELYGAMLDCRDWIAPCVHLFSTAVVDISLNELAQGKLVTGAGTDINCVGEHILRNRIRRALIVTDGYVGTPSERVASVLTRTRLAVALFGTDLHALKLKPYAGRMAALTVGEEDDQAAR